MFKKAPVAAAALLGLALTAAPALAGEPTQVKVVYSDLDLTTPEGQKTLETRLDAAARKACDYDVRVTGSHLPTSQSRTCYRKATERAQDVMATAIDNATASNRLGG